MGLDLGWKNGLVMWASHVFTMEKGLKEFQLCDSRRLCKKPQDAQDDVTELFDLFDAYFWGWKGI